MSEMSERRKLSRKYLAFFTRVYDAKNKILLGHLGDITTQGAMVISEQPIEIDKHFSIQLDLPEDLFGTDRLLLEAKSVWCEPDVHPNFFNTGFEFLNLSWDNAQLINKIIETYAIRE